MARTDELIKQDIVDQLILDDSVDASKVSVEVSNGTATLRGEVPTYLTKTSAYDDAIGVIGVTGVRNQLVVRYPSTASVPTDEEMETRIHAKLSENPDIAVTDMEIEVGAGVVTLRGTVDAMWKKIHAEDIVSLEPGVVLIENHLAVVPERDLVDQEIARDIVTKLESKVAVDADDVNVRVRDGQVNLSGTVPSWLARNEAYSSALFTPGVVDVTNRLAVSGLARAW